MHGHAEMDLIGLQYAWLYIILNIRVFVLLLWSSLFCVHYPVLLTCERSSSIAWGHHCWSTCGHYLSDLEVPIYCCCTYVPALYLMTTACPVYRLEAEAERWLEYRAAGESTIETSEAF